MLAFVLSNIFLLTMAGLEYSQAAMDIYLGNYARAIIMFGAGTSSLAFIWVVV